MIKKSKPVCMSSMITVLSLNDEEIPSHTQIHTCTHTYIYMYIQLSVELCSTRSVHADRDKTSRYMRV